MATLKALTKKKKKKVDYTRRPRTGIGAASVDKGFAHLKDYFQVEVVKADKVKLMKAFIKKNYSKDDSTVMLSAPDWVYNCRVHVAACMQWVTHGLEFEKIPYKRKVLQLDGTTRTEELESFYDGHEAIRRFVADATEAGTTAIAEKAEDTEAVANVIVLTPTQRYQAKVNDTILTDLDELEDQWIGGEEPEFDLYNGFRLHGLTGKAAEPVRKRLEGWLLDFNDSYNKQCDQAVEGYSHIKRSVMRRRIKHVEDMLADCDKIKAATAATRKISKPRVKSADKQVAKMKYKKDDSENKLVSINPISIIGAMRLFVFNSKTREITEYVSDKASGFSIKGTTLQGVDLESDNTRKIRLRKPEDFLHIVQSKSLKLIDKAWATLTTKESKPNGRINADCILIRVVDK